MKMGFRSPSPRRSFSAKTTGKVTRTVKKSVNPLYGKKGSGYLNDPTKAVYNKVYNQTTKSVISQTNDAACDYDNTSYNAENDSVNKAAAGCSTFLVYVYLLPVVFLDIFFIILDCYKLFAITTVILFIIGLIVYNVTKRM